MTCYWLSVEQRITDVSILQRLTADDREELARMLLLGDRVRLRSLFTSEKVGDGATSIQAPMVVMFSI